MLNLFKNLWNQLNSHVVLSIIRWWLLVSISITFKIASDGTPEVIPSSFNGSEEPSLAPIGAVTNSCPKFEEILHLFVVPLRNRLVFLLLIESDDHHIDYEPEDYVTD